MRNTHLLPGFWRGVNINQNAIFLECFIDELAEAAGKDPLEFRRSIMSKNPKSLAVLNAVAEKAGWGKEHPKGHYLGLAHFRAFGSYIAACAEISVQDGNKVKVHRIVGATDCGYAVNPAQVERQVAGSFVYGLSAALYGEITVGGGAIEQANFDSYPMLKMADAPEMETHLALSGGKRWGGIGEPATPPIAPAVCNAIFAITGKRIRSLPISDTELTGRT